MQQTITAGLVFFSEMNTLEEAYCYGLDAFEYMMSKEKNAQNCSYFLFLRDSGRAKSLKGFDWIDGPISVELLEKRYPRYTTHILLSGKPKFTSRVCHLLHEMSNRPKDVKVFQHV